MDEVDVKIIMALAENNMNIQDTANQLFMARNTVMYHIRLIQVNTGKNARNFYDLCDLLSMVGGKNVL